MDSFNLNEYIKAIHFNEMMLGLESWIPIYMTGQVSPFFKGISKEEFNNLSPTLCLLNCFIENKIYYTYEEYIEHLYLTKFYMKNNKNYKLSTKSTQTFKNIQILICEKNWVMISKASNPSIHFIIRHPGLRDAIENFIPPVVE